jgi:hypothetical protein
MFQLFRSDDRRQDEVAAASRRNEAAYDDLRDALNRLLAERNLAGPAPQERQQ